MGDVNIIDHPLILHKLPIMRKKETSTANFRRLAQELSMLLAYEVTRDFPTSEIEIETPLARMSSRVLDGKKIVFISILRAGNGILDGMLRILPTARVGHVGLYRDPKALAAVEYYFKLPPNMEERDAIVVDPMLAPANSSIAAVERIKESRPKSLKFACLLASPENAVQHCLRGDRNAVGKRPLGIVRFELGHGHRRQRREIVGIDHFEQMLGEAGELRIHP